MKNILIINAHHPYPGVSEGKFNNSLATTAQRILSEAGHKIKTTKVSDGYDVQEELAKHKWADVVILQSPVNWMTVTWSFKKYMDEVYTAGMMGDLCKFDGRHKENPKVGYGTGGLLTDSKYMMSLTFNAPAEAFENPEEYLFGEKSVDDLFFHMHSNFRFFGMKTLPTFACFDVMKNGDIENDHKRYEEHLKQHIA